MFSTSGVGSRPALVTALEQAAAALVAEESPSPAAALAEVHRLLRVVDLLGLVVDRLVGVVDATGEAKAAGFASTSAWLCADRRMNRHTAGVHRRNARQLRRLPATSEALAAGTISYAMAGAIASAVQVLDDDDDAQAAEQILLELASDEHTTVEKVAVAGRYLRQVVDPRRHLADHERACRGRYVSCFVEDDGSMSGAFRLPPEPAARLQALFDTYARKASPDDRRTRAQRNADALTQMLVSKVSAELLVVVNAETLTHDEAEPLAGHETDTPGTATSSQPTDTSSTHSNGQVVNTSDTDSEGHLRNASGADSSSTHSSSQAVDETGTDNTGHHTGGSSVDNEGHLDGNSGVDTTGHLGDSIGSVGADDGSGTDEGSGTDVALSSSRGVFADPHHSRGQPDALARTAFSRSALCDVPGLLRATGHPLPAPHVRRLARQSRLYRMVLQAPSKVLDLGDAVRLVPGWMRRAIYATYDTCAYDSCPIPARWCEMDHIHPWTTHHTTRLDDIAPACDHHNRDRAKHPDKYTITKTPDGRWHILSTTRRRPATTKTRTHTRTGETRNQARAGEAPNHGREETSKR